MSYFILIALIFSSLTYAAGPAPVGLAYSGKQCIKYWAGDECVQYTLPEGFKELYPLAECKEKEGFCYQYKGKECQPSANPAICCQKFGFKFVKKNLVTKRVDSFFCKKPEKPKGLNVDGTVHQ